MCSLKNKRWLDPDWLESCAWVTRLKIAGLCVAIICLVVLIGFAVREIGAELWAGIQQERAERQAIRELFPELSDLQFKALWDRKALVYPGQDKGSRK